MAPRKNLNFDELVAGKKLTPEGKAWLIAALDPFHDRPLEIQGLPDTNTVPSAVVLDRKTLSVMNPGVGIWDCVVVWMPLLASNGQCVEVSGSAPDIGHTTSVVGHPFGTVLVMTGPTGDNFGIRSSTAGGHANYVLSAGSPRDARMIAGGIEMVNTTPEIYRSGSVTATLLNFDRGFKDARFDDGGGGAYMSHYTKMFDVPFSDTSIYSSLPDATTWPAARGAYMPIRLKKFDHQYATPFIWQFLAGYGNGSMVGNRVNLAGAVSDFSARSTTDITGMQVLFFKGLSAETTFDLVVKVWDELAVCPDTEGTITDVVKLATPAAPYDPKAFALYEQILRMTPLAVPQDMNPGGEFFGSILKVVGKAAETAGLIAPYVAPAMDMVVPGSGMIARGATLPLTWGGKGVYQIGKQMTKEAKAKKQAKASR